MDIIPCEYKVLVEYINPEERGLTLHFSHEDEQQAFTNILEVVFEHLAESIPTGWEVNSHSVAICRDTIIVTVLIQHPVNTD
jgi:hypothetical protein